MTKINHFCSIHFDIDDILFRSALLRKYAIKDCFVRLDRLEGNGIIEAPPQKLLRLESKHESVRSNVSWMPAPSSISQNAADALAALAMYQQENRVVAPIARKCVKRHRAKSMFAESTWQSHNSSGAKRFSIDDMHVELQEKMNRPNKGLKPCGDRQLPERSPSPISHMQKMMNEIKATFLARKANKV